MKIKLKDLTLKSYEDLFFLMKELESVKDKSRNEELLNLELEINTFARDLRITNEAKNDRNN